MSEPVQAKESVQHLPRQKLDISLSVCISEAAPVCVAVRDIFLACFPGQESEFAVIETMFVDIDRMYHGRLPGYYACDTDYHDLRHILDVTLAATRLYAGYEKVHGGTDQALGQERFLQGIVGALFHDIGYIRQREDSKHKHGAEYTKTHVARGIQFLAGYLPTLGKQAWIAKLGQLLQFTGYEELATMQDPLDHTLGCLLGTADLIAQMSDRVYLERCRDFLYQEFKIGDIPAPTSDSGQPFASPIDLLHATPNFIRSTKEKRLDDLFGSVYRYAADYFGGDNLYMDGIEENCSYLEELIEEDQLDHLMRPNR
ncbi:MAG: hypothetical protein DRQ62_05970 [Gammaproteobacteria bacterium]|nr:MAG: hypothetical protein DRQ62_05970 [Gammaproteobacteria bacterium]